MDQRRQEERPAGSSPHDPPPPRPTPGQARDRHRAAAPRHWDDDIRGSRTPYDIDGLLGYVVGFDPEPGPANSPAGKGPVAGERAAAENAARRASKLACAGTARWRGLFEANLRYFRQRAAAMAKCLYGLPPGTGDTVQVTAAGTAGNGTGYVRCSCGSGWGMV